jgi:protein N-terminal methyltransferase
MQISNHDNVMATFRHLSTTSIKMADAHINHQDARNYWQGIDADVNGMLGGFPYISRVDLQGSKNFLAKLGVGGKGKEKVKRAVDCGAG